MSKTSLFTFGAASPSPISSVEWLLSRLSRCTNLLVLRHWGPLFAQGWHFCMWTDISKFDDANKVLNLTVFSRKQFLFFLYSLSVLSSWLKHNQSTAVASKTKKSQQKYGDQILLLAKVPSHIKSNHLMSGVADAIRSSLGPKGMDKMIQTEKTTIITNDGATILKHMAVLHPAARMVNFHVTSPTKFVSWSIFLLPKTWKQVMGLLQSLSLQEVS